MEGKKAHTEKVYSMIKFDTNLYEECFDFDFESGDAFWKIRPQHHFKTTGQHRLFNSRYAGKRAGYIKKDGRTSYRIVKICGKTIHIHRILYMCYHNCQLTGEIDHFDGDGLNNSISNLREVSRKENARNQRMYTSNVAGITGVCIVSSRKYVFMAYYKHPLTGKNVSKVFDNLFDACCFRKSFELSNGYSSRHGT